MRTHTSSLRSRVSLVFLFNSVVSSLSLLPFSPLLGTQRVLEAFFSHVACAATAFFARRRERERESLRCLGPRGALILRNFDDCQSGSLFFSRTGEGVSRGKILCRARGAGFN